MDKNKIIHILRNPYGKSESQIREVRRQAANLIESTMVDNGKSKRQQLTHGQLLLTVEDIADKVRFRSKQKGLGVFVSSHEILGVLNEEMLEYTMEVQLNGSDKQKIEELKDIAVACVFGIASIQSGGTQW